MMKAIIQDRYGSPDILRMENPEKPEPVNDEVRIRVEATALNSADWRILRANPFFIKMMFGFRRPRTPIPGSDVAGVVDATGPEASRYKVGDSVFGALSSSRRGGCAEYVCASENLLVATPESLSHTEAAALPMAGLTALQALRDSAEVSPGQKVLIHGAAGGVGGFAVQLAVILGAEVTGVCSGEKQDMVRSMGASRVIDYKSEDFSRSDERYDVIIAVNGHRRLAEYGKVMKKGGRLVFIGGSNTGQLVSMLAFAPIISVLMGWKVLSMVAEDRTDDMAYLASLVEQGTLSPMIDRCYPLEDTADAFRYIGQGHARGKILITKEKQI